MYVVPKRRDTASSKHKSGGDDHAYSVATHTKESMDTAATTFALPTDTHILDGFIDSQDGAMMRQCTRDMYYHDPICGGCVDIYSALPFGQFSLSGVPDREVLDKHLECCDAIRLETLFPSVTIDQLVDGAITGALSFNEKLKIFDKYLPLNLDCVEVFINPFHGEDALLDIKLDQDLQNLVFKKTGDARVERLLNQLPELLRQFFKGGKMLKLDPENTVYVPRLAHLSHYKVGSSLFRRAVPIWLMEKALMRGTIEQAYRRQRGIMWIQMGGPDYVASIAEMQQMGSDVVLADRDPLGAVLVTRPDVSFQEIREGGALWKHSDVVDTYTPLKLKAMGFPDALDSGELSVGGADTVMSVFNRTLRNQRDGVVRALCYDKIFPYVSIANDFKKEDRLLETSKAVKTDKEDTAAEEMLRELASPYGERIFTRNGRHMAIADSRLRSMSDKDPRNFYIPTIHFHDSLRPEVQSDYLDTLDKLQAHNVPIPMRAWIAAAGIGVGDLVASMDEDLDLRKVLFDQMKKIKKYLPADPNAGGGAGGGGNFANLVDAADNLTASASADRRGILDREDDLGEVNERYLRNINGGPLSARGKALLENRADKVLAESGAKLGQQVNFETRKFGSKGREIARKAK